MLLVKGCRKHVAGFEAFWTGCGWIILREHVFSFTVGFRDRGESIRIALLLV